MNWSTKEDFIEWVKQQKDDASSAMKEYISKGCYDNENFTYCYSKGNMSFFNSDVSIKIFEELVDDTILEHFNFIMYNSTIDIYFLQSFLITVDNVNYYKNSTLNTLSKNEPYEVKIKKLKKRADEMQYYSDDQLMIRIPVLPHVAIYEMVSIFERYRVNNDTIRHIQGYFGTERKQKNSDAYKNRQKEWNNKAKFIKDVFEVKAQMHYYTAKNNS